MQHIRQLQTALTILMGALVLLIISGIVLIYSYSPGEQTAVAASTGTAPRADDPGQEATVQPAALDEVAQAGKVCSITIAPSATHWEPKHWSDGLKGLNQRRPEAWLISWIKIPSR